jgi:L-serine dehydratase
MAISVFDLFTIGIGPSSSHCVGPMRAAHRFAQELELQNLLGKTARVVVRLYGSLALTGKGHGTDKAILLGLEGETPEQVDPDAIDRRVAAIHRDEALRILGQLPIVYNAETDLLCLGNETLPFHTNGMNFVALDAAGQEHCRRVYYSVGGGFVVDEGGQPIKPALPASGPPPFPFYSGDDLLRMGAESGLSVSEMTLRNELCWRSREEIFAGLLRVWEVMQACVQSGCHGQGVLPGGLNVRRRAAELYRRLEERARSDAGDGLSPLDWIDVFALAVSEENAAGRRVVTAPTNGAAGIIPAVMHYYHRFCAGAADEQKVNEQMVRFLLTAGAIAMLFKEKASLSGAEVGCQGEVGVACSMAAGALTEVLGGTVAQVEQAAEIGMEHNLGLTCDPVGGLVQVPCIERNAMASVAAVNASRLALNSDGRHRVSLDNVIATMRETGADMSHKYKETSRGGLALNVVQC